MVVSNYQSLGIKIQFQIPDVHVSALYMFLLCTCFCFVHVLDCIQFGLYTFGLYTIWFVYVSFAWISICYSLVFLTITPLFLKVNSRSYVSIAYVIILCPNHISLHRYIQCIVHHH
eukprot:739586_1